MDGPDVEKPLAQAAPRRLRRGGSPHNGRIRHDTGRACVRSPDSQFERGVAIALFRLSAIAAILIAVASPARAGEPLLYRGEFTLSYYGLPIARANFDSYIDSRSYSINGSVSSAGLAVLFDDTKGTLTTSGTFRRGATQPDRFRADYLSGKKQTMVELLFGNGNVTKVTNVPPLKKRRKDWVPLGDSDLKAVTDPIAATLVQADSLDEVCRGQTVGIFDGEMRADLTLTQVSRGTISVRGYDGDTVVCRMRFSPVAGYHKNRRALEYLRTKSRIDVTFAPLGETGVYAPVYATVGTEVGTITVSARRFEVAK